MAREILEYVVTVEVKHREVVSTAGEEVFETLSDIGEGADRRRERGWVKRPEGSTKVVVATEGIYTQTVESLDMVALVSVVNKLGK